MVLSINMGAFAYVGCFLTWADSLESCWMPVDLPGNPSVLAFQRTSSTEFICQVSYEDLGFALKFPFQAALQMNSSQSKRDHSCVRCVHFKI